MYKKLTEIEHKIKKHVLPEIDYAFQKNVSYSQFSIYKKCPHQWNLTYIENKLPPSESIHTVFGTAFHETLQHYITVMFEESKKKANSLDLEEYFRARFAAVYLEEFTKAKKHFTTPTEMQEFYDDAVAILTWIKKHQNRIFTTRNVRLLGIELPLLIKLQNNLYYKAYIDFAVYDMDTDIVTIYDIKTSTRGWKDSDKKDELKVSQIILYKQFFAQQYDFDVDKIEVEFMIVKRKIYEQSEYPIPRVQSFKPASGSNKRNKAVTEFQNFIKDCFDESGKYQIKSYIKNVGESSCKWCPYRENKELCDKNNVLT